MWSFSACIIIRTFIAFRTTNTTPDSKVIIHLAVIPRVDLAVIP